MNDFTAVAAQVAGYLRGHGYPQARSTPAGEIHLPHATIIADTHWHARRWIGATVDRAEDLAAAACTPGYDGAVPAVWHERTGKRDAADWLVTITGAQFVEMLAAYEIAAQVTDTAPPVDAQLAHGVGPDPGNRCLAPIPGGGVCIGPAGHDPGHDGP